MKVYLSSTLQDLEAEREAIKEVLGDECVVKHSYHAHERDLVASCLEDVDGCDLYIGILGMRYGFVPPGQERSITQLEYERAKGKPRLIFLKDESAIPLPATDHRTKENTPEKIEGFRELVSSGQPGEPRPAVFKTVEDLKLAVHKADSGFRERTTPAERKTQPAAIDVAAYTRKVVEQYGRVELDALVPPERDEQLRIPLSAIFVEQSVREDARRLSCPKRSGASSKRWGRSTPRNCRRTSVPRTWSVRGQRTATARPSLCSTCWVGPPRDG